MKLFYLLVFMFLMNSCSERQDFSYKDAEKSHVSFFIEDNPSVNLIHDIDKSLIEGSFITTDMDEYINAMNVGATNNKWERVFNKGNRMVYIKESGSFASICILSFDGKNISLKILGF